MAQPGSDHMDRHPGKQQGCGVALTRGGPGQAARPAIFASRGSWFESTELKCCTQR